MVAASVANKKKSIKIYFSFSIKKCNRPPEWTSKLQKMPPALQRKHSPLQYIFDFFAFSFLFSKG
jgi:hypothetical protein